MMNTKQKNRLQGLPVLLTVLCFAMSFSMQGLAEQSDADQILNLMSSLSNHSKLPSEVLDPQVKGADRDKNLGQFSSSPYELSVVPTAGPPAISGDSASLPVRVHYKAEDGNSLDVSSTAQFVRRDGRWYFANFDFMKWPAFLIVILVLGILVGVGYASIVLVLRARLARQGNLGANAVKMFIPFFWPSLFAKTR